MLDRYKRVPGNYFETSLNFGDLSDLQISCQQLP